MHPIGTEVWVYDGEELEKVPCVYDLGEITRARHVRDRTSLSYRGERFELGDYESQDHQFIVKFDDAYIFERALSDKIYLQIYIGLSNRSDEPTVSGEDLVPPEAKKGFLLSGYVHAIGANINAGEFIGRTVSFKESGEIEETGTPKPREWDIEPQEAASLSVGAVSGILDDVMFITEIADLSVGNIYGELQEILIDLDAGTEKTTLSVGDIWGSLNDIEVPLDAGTEEALLSVGNIDGSLNDVTIEMDERTEEAFLSVGEISGTLDDMVIGV